MPVSPGETAATDADLTIRNLAVEVYRYSKLVGHSQTPRAFFDMCGAPGSYGASHAERRALVANPAATDVTVSQMPCYGGQTWFRAEAGVRGSTISFHAPTLQGPASRSFMPNGTAWVTPFVGRF